MLHISGWESRLYALILYLFGVQMFAAPTTAYAEDVANRTIHYVTGSVDTPLVARFKRALQEKLKGYNLVSINPEDIDDRQLTISVGLSALQSTYKPSLNNPVISTFVSRYQFERVKQESGRNGVLTSVFLDPPLTRQALLGRAILPNVQKIALIASEIPDDLFSEDIITLKQLGFEPTLYRVNENNRLPTVLNRALMDNQIIIGTLDKVIYNGSTIKHVLLTAYRHNRVLIGPTLSYVKAGAIASSYCDAEQLAEQVAVQVRHYFKTRQLLLPQYCDDFELSINRQVARSLNIVIPDNEKIKSIVKRAEVNL